MKINIERIKRDIDRLSEFSSSQESGVTRLSFTPEMKEARNYLIKEMEKYNLKIWEDGYSNIFARREGEDKTLKPIMIGSHYDSVINAGKFDGIAGLVAALEVIRLLEENNISTSHPIELVAMNDEEGVRFGTGISNSRAMAGLITKEELNKQKDKDGISLYQAMKDYGVDVNLEDAIREKGSLKAFIELHIEQGPVLEENSKTIGLVETIVGLDRYEITFIGKAGHAGTTPMLARRDALPAASKFILDIKEEAIKEAKACVATVGEISLSPNASNVIPERVKISLDMRAPSEDSIFSLRKSVDRICEEIRETGIEVLVEKSLYIPPVDMNKELVDLLEDESKKLNLGAMRMISGAGHDAMIMASLAPTAMIFVPSRDGLSHHPDEWTDYEDLEAGTRLLLETVIRLASYN